MLPETKHYALSRTNGFVLDFSGCPTAEGLFLNADDTADYVPVTEVEFDAFRFKEEERVVFTLTVRVCKGRTSDRCNFRVSDVTSIFNILVFLSGFVN